MFSCSVCLWYIFSDFVHLVEVAREHFVFKNTHFEELVSPLSAGFFLIADLMAPVLETFPSELQLQDGSVPPQETPPKPGADGPNRTSWSESEPC